MLVGDFYITPLSVPYPPSPLQPITTRPRSILTTLAVFNEDIQKGVGGIPILFFQMGRFFHMMGSDTRALGRFSDVVRG